MGKIVTLGPSAFDIWPHEYLIPSFSETFQSEIYLMLKQVFLLNAQFTIVCFDVTLW